MRHSNKQRDKVVYTGRHSCRLSFECVVFVIEWNCAVTHINNVVTICLNAAGVL